MNIISDYLNTLELIPVITDSLIAGGISQEEHSYLVNGDIYSR